VTKTTQSNSSKQSLQRLLTYLYPQSFFLVLAVIGFALYAATQPMSALLIEWLIKTLDGEFPNGNMIVPAAFIGVAVVRGIGTYMGSYYINKVAQRMIENIRKNLFANIVQMPLKEFDQHQSGKLVSLFTYNSNLMAGTAARSVTVVVQEGLTVIALLAYLFWSNWQFTSMFILLAPPIALIINWAGKKIKAFGKNMQNAMAELNGNVTQSFSGIRLIKEVAAEQKSSSQFANIASQTRKLALNITKINAIYTPTMQIMIAIAMALVMLMLINAKGDMETSQLIAYVTAAAMLSKPVRSLSGVHLQLTEAVVAAEEIFSFMDKKAQSNLGTQTADAVKGNITFNDVSFKYDNADSAVIQGLNLSIEKGQTVALVGRSGGGKSTIANLIPRFYDIDSGTIAIDDVSIADYELSSLRKNIAIVSQQIVLFNDSIANNIRYGHDAATPEQIQAAAKQANADEFIQQLPNGYDSLIGENGVMLSGGQIQHALESMMGNCTTVVIAHRLSTIEKADNILVIDQGNIVESGKHSELSNANGIYAKMLAKDFS